MSSSVVLNFFFMTFSWSGIFNSLTTHCLLIKNSYGKLGPIWCNIINIFSSSIMLLSLSRIYFDTPTFDRIINDQAAKFVDILSTIGGTMGLLTGFSIISGIEIIFFAVEMILALMKKYKWSKTMQCFIIKYYGILFINLSTLIF